ncbi:MAG: twin-arginine translocase subunit TatC, partial [Prevotella sp.]|nr:twin-arginine translocase subunit TatC [Prevotella sp.]
IFPLTFRFLGTYQVSEDVVNMISLQSYMSTLVLMSLSMGIVFEMPVVSCLMARMGLLSSSFMSRYRRHAIVVILIVAAIITPTSDIFTLLMVSLPMWLLYEVSVGIVKLYS